MFQSVNSGVLYAFLAVGLVEVENHDNILFKCLIEKRHMMPHNDKAVVDHQRITTNVVESLIIIRLIKMVTSERTALTINMVSQRMVNHNNNNYSEKKETKQIFIDGFCFLFLLL